MERFLESASNTLDYRRYGDQFFDVLVAGGLLGKQALVFRCEAARPLLRAAGLIRPGVGGGCLGDSAGRFAGVGRRSAGQPLRVCHPPGRHGDQEAERRKPAGLRAGEGRAQRDEAVPQMVERVLRRYKYMQQLLEEHVAKVLKFLKAFSPEQRGNLAKVRA